MWPQILAIAWAQFRTTRNHLPRAGIGAYLGGLLLALWYCLYAGLATILAVRIPDVPLSELDRWLPVGLLGVFLFWQLVPLFTLSSGWSLQLNKLQVYPIKSSTLFGIETILRVTSAPEMLLIIAGAIAGLMRHPSVPVLAPLCLLLFVPFNLFVQLGLRDMILHSFERNRFRELFAVIVISISVLPQLLVRTSVGHALSPYFFAVAKGSVAPWREAATLGLGSYHLLDLLLLLTWNAASLAFANWMFNKSLRADDTFQSASRAFTLTGSRRETGLVSWPSRLFRDPLAVLVEKDLQSLARMPKFRVVFGMACILGIAVFIPLTLDAHQPGSSFLRSNFVPFVNLYGLLLLSDMLLLNAFGLDRAAAQTYFLAPIPLVTVIKAKNLTAVIFVVIQSTVVLLIAALAQARLTAMTVLSAVFASSVVTIFLLITGNITSLVAPRPIDPKQTFKKQAGAKMQLWLLACTVGMFVLVGFAYLARYAFNSDWVLLAVLGFEFLIGLVLYRFGLESAVTRGTRHRETIVALLSKNVAPLSLD